VLLRPLPFEEPERLVRIFTKAPDGRNFELSPGKFYSWQRNARSFEDMAMSSGCGFRELALTGTGAARLVRATAVSAGFFEIVRARPALGRVFRQEEDTPGGRHVVILSDRFWKTELGGAPDVLGRTLKLSDEAYTIVGVMLRHLDPSRTHRQGARRPWESLSGWRRAPERRRRSLSGAVRNECNFDAARA
jgi:hypothetical protein